jgi:hypothetical protein
LIQIAASVRPSTTHSTEVILRGRNFGLKDLKVVSPGVPFARSGVIKALRAAIRLFPSSVLAEK